MKRLKPLSLEDHSSEDVEPWCLLQDTSAQLATLQTNLEQQLSTAKESIRHALAMERQDKEAIMSKSTENMSLLKTELSHVLERMTELKSLIRADSRFTLDMLGSITQLTEVIRAQKVRASQSMDSAVMTDVISYPNDTLKTLSNALASLREIKARLASMDVGNNQEFITKLLMVIRHLKTTRLEEQRDIQNGILRICKKVSDLENLMTQSLHLKSHSNASRRLYALEVTTFYLCEGVRKRMKAIEEQSVKKAELDSLTIKELNSQLERTKILLDSKESELEANKTRICLLEAELTALKEANVRSNTSLITHPVIMFTNMPSSIDVARLKEWARKLGGSIHEGKEFCESITHVISTMQKSSIKVMAASLTQKWIVTPTWIEESMRCGYFVAEEPHGKLFQERPFKDKRFFLTPAFILENKGGRFDAVVCEALIQKVLLSLVRRLLL